MMKYLKNILLCAAAMIAAASLHAQIAPGEKAADFTLPDTDGEMRSLSDYEGQWVVLEWINHGCPFVVKHYATSNMQKLQESYRDKGVIWLSICSSAPGTQGHMSAEDAAAKTASLKAKPTAYLLDEKGEAGRAYGAKTTPEMYVINPHGQVVYHGAIDDNRSASHDSVATAKNYVSAALDQAMSGEPVATKQTRPYGCSVKYK